MKLLMTVLALTVSLSAGAEEFKCKTVMGGCPVDNAQVTSPHMHAPAAIPAQKPAQTATTAKSNTNIAQASNKTSSK